MFEISSDKIDPTSLRAGMSDPEAGGFVVFEGWVRNHHEGREVLRLEYEAYTELGITEGTGILAAARERFEISDCRCVHRVGELDIGDIAVWVGVTAVHRGPAFEACRFVIDEVKHRLPIWKKEFYTDGDSGWVNCEGCAQAHHHD